MDIKIINQLIENFDSQQLKELIIYIVSMNESAGESLLNYCQKKDEAEKTENHELIVESKIRQHWKKAAIIIGEFDMYGGGPDSDMDVAGDELQAMTKLLEGNKVP